MNKSFFYFLFGFFISLFLIGCGGKSLSDLNTDVARFVSSSDDVVGYGYVNLVAIKEKSQLSQEPTIGEFLNKELNSIENSLKLTDKVYYALEGPLSGDGMPKYTYVFMTVENEDSTLQMFQKMNFSFEEEKDLMFSYDENTAVGFNENIVVMVLGNFGGNPKDKLLAAFASFKNKEKDKNAIEILATKTDVLLAGDIENLYRTSNTSLNTLEVNNKAEINEMVKDGHFFMTVDFNKGDLTAKMDFSRVNDKMKENTFFKREVANDMLKNIGPGQPIVAMVMSLDIEKLENIMNDFSPGTEKLFYQSMGPMGDMFASLTGENLSDILNGDMGVVVTKEVSASLIEGVEGIPNSHLYLGLGKNPQNMKDLIETFAREDVIVDLGDGYYKIDQSTLLMKDKSILLHSNDTLKSNFKTAEIQISAGMDDFGSTPFSLFVDLNKFTESGLNQISSQYDMVLSIADYMTVCADNEQVTMKVVFKNKEVNILKQVIDVFKEDLQMRMGGISF